MWGGHSWLRSGFRAGTPAEGRLIPPACFQIFSVIRYRAVVTRSKIPYLIQSRNSSHQHLKSPPTYCPRWRCPFAEHSPRGRSRPRPCYIGNGMGSSSQCARITSAFLTGNPGNRARVRRETLISSLISTKAPRKAAHACTKTGAIEPQLPAAEDCALASVLRRLLVDVVDHNRRLRTLHGFEFEPKLLL